MKGKVYKTRLFTMNRLKKLTSELNQKIFASPDAERPFKVPIHQLTHDPTKAWEKMQIKQIVKNLEPLDPDTPVSSDKIRFVCLSDTHSLVEKLENFVPHGDVLLHAGDFTSVGLPEAIQKFDNFLDVLEDLGVKSSRELLKHCIYLMDSSIEICGIKIYGSPWQPEFCSWGFNLPRGKACLEKWDLIPEDTDILMTHGPPLGHGDLCINKVRAGCVELLTTVQTRVKPKYHLFGHIHEGYGITTDEQTIFINGSNCTIAYKPRNKPIVFDYTIPEGHSKSELDNLPVNNL